MEFQKHKIAWTFHENTSRWRHNTLSESENESPVPPFKEYPSSKQITLPPAKLSDMSLKETIRLRHSCRAYEIYKLSSSELSTILNYAYGVNNRIYLDKREFFERPVPSGGGLYSLELYTLVRNIESIEQGVYHFNIIPPSHLELIENLEFSPLFISQLFMNQFYLENCSCIIFICSFTERNMWKYGDRGYRYILFEAGHVAQNINLVTQALGLNSLNLGGFLDQEVSNLLKIDSKYEIPLYAVAVGKSKSKAKIRLPTEM